MSATTQAPIAVLEMTRSFSAPVEKVYRAFTESPAVARWGCGRSYENLAIDLDLRPGGVLHHRARHIATGVEWTFFGVYEQVIPNERLLYTFDWKTDWRQAAKPSLVELRFHSMGTRTEVELVHSRLPDPAIATSEQHWNEFLQVLEELLVRQELF